MDGRSLSLKRKQIGGSAVTIATTDGKQPDRLYIGAVIDSQKRIVNEQALVIVGKGRLEIDKQGCIVELDEWLRLFSKSECVVIDSQGRIVDDKGINLSSKALHATPRDIETGRNLNIDEIQNLDIIYLDTEWGPILLKQRGEYLVVVDDKSLGDQLWSGASDLIGTIYRDSRSMLGIDNIKEAAALEQQVAAKKTQ